MRQTLGLGAAALMLAVTPGAEASTGSSEPAQSHRPSDSSLTTQGASPSPASPRPMRVPVALRNASFGSSTGWMARTGTFVIASGAGRRGTPAAVISPSADGRIGFRSDVTAATVPAGQRYLGGMWVNADEGTVVEVSLVARHGATTVSNRSRVRFDRTGWRRISVSLPATAERGTVHLSLAASDVPAGSTVAVDDAALFWGRVLSTGCAMTMRGIAPCATLVGQAYGSNADPRPLERRFGRPLGVHRTYWRADQLTGATRMARRDLKVGRLPWISFKPPHDWKRMAAGAGDAWARSLTRRLGRLPGPVWVAIHHEPENDGTVAPWTAMQKRLAPIIRGGSWNIGFTIILMGYHQVYGPPGSPLRLPAIWPKRTRVDVAGFDIYNNYGQTDGGEVSRRTTNLGPDYFRYLSRWARKHNTHWGLAESGFTDLAARDDPNWVRRSVRQMMRRGGLAYSYFNTTLNTSQTFALTTDRKKDLFQRALDISPTFKQLRSRGG